jgi:lipopolysaccharide/colanic/teichoic acid biosynthesis glycosyltransferase
VARRLFDLVLAAAGVLLCAPLLLLAMVAIRCSSRGPVIYRATRVGRSGRAFTMYKLRTMHLAPGTTGQAGAAESRITGLDDPRVFAVGRLLRRAKIDELPQLINVLRGEMSIIGPRPEDPVFVRRHYAPQHLETLRVRPGLASPGSIYSTTHGDYLLTGMHPELAYAQQLLPIKLALDTVYVRRASPWYDARLVGRALGAIALTLAGRRTFPEPPEMAAAQRLVVPARHAAEPSWFRRGGIIYQARQHSNGNGKSHGASNPDVVRA